MTWLVMLADGGDKVASVFEILEGGVLHFTDEKHRQHYFAPGFWVAIHEEAKS